jgi:putative transposase
MWFPGECAMLAGFCDQSVNGKQASMFFRVVTFIWGFVLDLAALSGMTDDEKDLQILLLRQQLRIVERKKTTRLIIPRWQKVPLAVLAVRLTEKTNKTRKVLEESVQLFKPDTLLRWHRDLVRRKWTFKGQRKPGRPAIDPELEKWILQIAKDNPGLGFEKLEGEMRKLGLEVSFVTIRTVLRRHGVPPAPDRSRSSWRTFLNHYKDQFLACDFFTVETLTLKTLYVLFFIEHASRRVYLAGCAAQPNAAWVSQQARQMAWELEERQPAIRYLIHDHDTKFTQAFDTVFQSGGIEIVDIPYQAPNANAYAERRVRSVREECLDHLIILNERHLRQVLKEYVGYYNERRAHQALGQDSPIGLEPVSTEGPIRYRNVLGGIICDYYREAAWHLIHARMSFLRLRDNQLLAQEGVLQDQFCPASCQIGSDVGW